MVSRLYRRLVVGHTRRTLLLWLCHPNPNKAEDDIASPSCDCTHLTVVPAPILAVSSSYHACHHAQVFSSPCRTPRPMEEVFFLSYSTPAAPGHFTALLVSLKTDSITNLKKAKIEKAKLAYTSKSTETDCSSQNPSDKGWRWGTNYYIKYKATTG